jgi:hypothetical protein
LHLPVPLIIVTVFPVIEQEPVAARDAAVLALVLASTVNERPMIALVGAPVKLTIGVACNAVTVLTTFAAAL